MNSVEGADPPKSVSAGINMTINQDLALYTDADVMFYHEVNPCKLDTPRIMAIGPEMDRIAASWNELNWNSGVLLMNLQGLKAVLPDMIRFANSKQWDFTVMDQASTLQDNSPLMRPPCNAPSKAMLQCPKQCHSWQGHNPKIAMLTFITTKPGNTQSLSHQAVQQAGQAS